jgi:protein-tyrosine phosphatase
MERLEGLGLHCICDFRGAYERRNAPDRLPVSSHPRVIHLEIDQRALVSEATAERSASPEVTAEDLTEGMRESYRRMVTHCTDQFKVLMRLLCTRANLPLLMHCTGGKDRSGYAAAIVLGALGVPREIVFEDYLLTNQLIAPGLEAFKRELARSLEIDIGADTVTPLFAADETYLEASFDEMERSFGTFDDYLRQGLGFSDEQRQTLQDHLLDRE